MPWFIEEKGIRELSVKNFLFKLTGNNSIIELLVLGYWIQDSKGVPSQGYNLSCLTLANAIHQLR